MVKKIFFIILILAGFFLRLYKLEEIPAGLFMDEATIAVDAKSIAQDGTDQYGRRYPFYFEALSDFRLPGYVYATAIGFKFFGSSLLTVKLASLIFSIATIFLLGYLTKLLFSEKKNLPLISMAVLSLSPFHIHFSRIGYETMMASFFMLVYFISLVHVFKKKDATWALIGLFSVIISCVTYPGAKFIIPALAITFILLAFFNVTFHQNRKNMIVYSLMSLGAVFLAFIPGILQPVSDKRSLNYLKQGTDGTFLGIIAQKPKLMFNSWLYAFDFQFLFQKGDLFAYRHGTKEQGIFLSIFLIPFILGILTIIKRFNSKSFSIPFLIILTIVIGIPSALTSNTPYGTRILPMVIPFSIFIALGIDIFIIKVNKLKKLPRLSVYALVVIVLYFQIFLFFHIYFIHFRTTSLPEFPGASREMALFVKDFKNNNPEKQIYFLNNRSCRLWSHDDLYLWYFADLKNKEMIKWNNKYREERYKYGSPFDAYDKVFIPPHSFENIKLYSGFEEMKTAPVGSLFVKCGVHLNNLDLNNEKVVKKIYLYPNEMDLYYIITSKL